MKVKDKMFGFEIEVKLFNLSSKRPIPPKGFIEIIQESECDCFNICPNCGQMPIIRKSDNGFQDREIQNVLRAIMRIYNKGRSNGKSFAKLFSVDLEPALPKYSTMLCRHPSRYHITKFDCCGTTIWCDYFYPPMVRINTAEKKYYYSPTSKNKSGLDAWM